MRLPIQSMQSVRLRSLQNEADPWYRSVIVDFEENQELVLLLPSEKDRERPGAEAFPEEEGEEPLEEADGAAVEPPPDDSAPSAGESQPDPPPSAVTDPESEAAPPDEQIVVGDDDSDLLKPPPFQKGTRIEVEISFTDGIRRFVSVVRRLDLNYGGAMRVEWPSEGTRIQRRDYVRVDVTYRVLVWFRNEEGKLEQVKGFTTDISAGGVRLKLPQPLPADQRIEMEIQDAGLSAQTLQGRVVRSGELPKKRNEPQFYWVAVEFVGVGEGLRKEMTQMVFVIQREQMKKSLK